MVNVVDGLVVMAAVVRVGAAAVVRVGVAAVRVIRVMGTVLHRMFAKGKAIYPFVLCI